MASSPSTAEKKLQLSGITIIYLIAIGFQVFVLLFILAKRQIMRLAWGSRKDLRRTVGYNGGSKATRTAITEQINSLKEFGQYQPELITSEMIESTAGIEHQFIHRMKVLDLVQGELNMQLVSCKLVKHNLTTPFAEYLTSLRKTQELAVTDETIQRLGELYERARFSSDKFTEVEYNEFYRLLHDYVISALQPHRRSLLPRAAISVSLTEKSRGDSNDESEVDNNFFKSSDDQSFLPLLRSKKRLD